ncbi:hypothetical protein EDB85DRAFT_1899032 [Lactarius pseudohatsudake]|nr:hypothetical protein EDB85DRAFT_1899032 [Lactarius pseudohatsudake]
MSVSENVVIFVMAVSGPREVPRTTTPEEPPTFGPSLGCFCLEDSLPQEVLPAIKDNSSSLETNVSLQMSDTVFQYGGGIAYTFIPSARNGDLIGAVDPCGLSETIVSYIRRPRPQADPMPLMTRFGDNIFWRRLSADKQEREKLKGFLSEKAVGVPSLFRTLIRSRVNRRRRRMYEYAARAHHATCEVLVEFCSTKPQSVRGVPVVEHFPRVTLPPLLSEKWHSFPSSVGGQQGVLATMT